MLGSLLQHPHRYLAILLGLSAISLSLSVRGAGVEEGAWLPPVAVMNNDELLESADLVRDAEQPLDNGSLSQREMNNQWLASGMSEQQSDEGSDALRELAKTAVKAYWKTLVQEDANLETYTPVVEGRMASRGGETDYDVRLSGDTLRVKVEYHF